MAMLQVVLGLQREILASIGAQNPLVKPDQLYATLEKITEAAGFPSADPFFTRPDPAEVQALMQQGQGGDTGAAEKMAMDKQKIEAEIALSQQKAQAEGQLAREKMQAEIQLSREKMQAEIQMGRERMQMQAFTGQNMPATSSPAPVRFGGQVG